MIDVDLLAVAHNLFMVGNFTGIAYYGFRDLQVEIHRIGIEVSELCDKSALTVGKFKQASGCFLVNLQATYQFLLNGMEEMAIETLQSTANVTNMEWQKQLKISPWNLKMNRKKSKKLLKNQ